MEVFLYSCPARANFALMKADEVMEEGLGKSLKK